VSGASAGYFLRAESFFNVATNIEELDEGPGGPPLIDSYGGVSLHEQSHGESFLSLILNRFGSNGLYVLDERLIADEPEVASLDHDDLRTALTSVRNGSTFTS
jgi:predicted ATPase